MSDIEQGESCYTIKRKVLCEVLFASPLKSMDGKFKHLAQYLSKETNCPKEQEVNHALRNFKQQFMMRWAKSNKYKLRFMETEKKWLNDTCSFKFYQILPSKSGRPTKEFSESSDQSKRRKTANLRETYSADELIYAAQMKLRSSGKSAEASHIQKIIKPDIANTIVDNSGLQKLTSVQALSLLMEAQLSKKQYNIIRNYAKDLFPPYKDVEKEKAASYPEDIKYSDVEAEVSLQSLLDHTTTRLLSVQEDVMTTLKPENKFTLHVKWGFDGSSSHTQYMQRFNSEESDDKYMFLTSLVPIRLSTIENNKSVVVWQNPRPSSPRFCRPIKLQYQKETTELSKTTKAYIDSQINELQDTKVTLKDKQYSVSYNLIFTMVDGKICNALSDTKSTMKCYLCGATSKEFNNLTDAIERPIRREYLSFGISVLHSWIRLFECLLHVAYKLPVKSWRISKDTKAQIEENKHKIQNEFKRRLSLIVDKPKPGFGNTNDGNVARKFFQNYDVSADITGLDKKMIYRFYIILQVISSKFKINTEKFTEFCHETAHLYISLYPWCPMTTTVHKILIHGSEIISEFLIPIGCLSEEAQEARNKDFKVYRERFSRKCSREDNMKDVFNRLLISSDPIITYTRSLPVLDRKLLDPEAIALLIDDN